MITTLRAIVMGTMAFLLLTGAASAQATGDYRSKQTGTWATAATWERYNGSSWVAAASAPSSSDGVITILNGHTVTVAADVTVDQVVIAAGGKLVVSGNNVDLTVANGTGTDLDVYGTLRLENSANDIGINTGATIVFENGGVHEHALNAGTVPTATWSDGSTLKMLGPASTGSEPAGLGQSFYNLVWDMTGSASRTPLAITTIRNDFIINGISGSLMKLSQGNSSTHTINIGRNFLVNIPSGKTVAISAGGADMTVNVGGDYIQNAAADNTAGTVDLNDNGQSASGTMYLTGHFKILAGTTTATGPSSISFVGTVDQNIQVLGTWSGPVNVTVDKPSGRVMLLTDFTVDGRATMTMTRGNIITSPAYVWTLGTSTSRLGTLAWTSGTIVGRFRRWYSADVVSGVLYPIGTESFHRPAVLSFTTAPTAGGTVTGSHTAADPGDAGTPISDGSYTIGDVAADGYWTMTAGDALTGGVYSLELTATGFAGITDLNDVHMVKRANSASNWTVQGTHVLAGGTLSAPIAKRSGMSGFSDFGIGGAGDNPLPIELADFRLSSTDGVVSLYWRTASEIENQGFEVQRAETGADFRTIASYRNRVELVGMGTSARGRDYSFVDDGSLGTLVPGITYRYRLVDVALDGGRTVHPEKSIRVEGTAIDPINLGVRLGAASPNPATDAVSMLVTMPEAGTASLTVIDPDGRQMTRDARDLVKGINSVSVDTSNLRPGAYTVRLITAAGVRTQKFLIVR